MDFYYRSLSEGRCEIVCTRCFLTLGAAQAIEEIRRIERLHQCAATRIPAQAVVSTRTLSKDPEPRNPATWGAISRGTADRPVRPAVRNALRLSAAAFAFYFLPTAFEFVAMHHWNPWISSLLLGDLAGCAFLCVVLRKVKAGICLYCLLTVFEAGACWLRIMPLSVLPWFTDLVPTLVVSAGILRSSARGTRLFPIS